MRRPLPRKAEVLIFRGYAVIPVQERITAFTAFTAYVGNRITAGLSRPPPFFWTYRVYRVQVLHCLLSRGVHFGNVNAGNEINAVTVSPTNRRVGLKKCFQSLEHHVPDVVVERLKGGDHLLVGYLDSLVENYVG